ncbi:MAG TPA: cyclase family protein [Vicinamibacterales bacterium]|nr:cyclase family protein [Vicinamibacterales bacterium]
MATAACGLLTVWAAVRLSHVTGAAPNAPGAGAPFAHVVDLTHALDENTPYIPVQNITFPFRKTPIATFATHGVAAYRWQIHEHLGTHVDAPSHFIEGGLSVDRLSVDRLVVPLVVIDVSMKITSDPDASLTIADIDAWERRHGRIPTHAAVMMASGWDSRINDAKAFVNADAAGAMHFPGFSPAAASFLARSRDVSGLGVDTLSIDPGIDTTYRAHKAWLAGGKWAAELAANLRQVPASGATVFVGVARVRGATGSPVRMLAVW